MGILSISSAVKMPIPRSRREVGGLGEGFCKEVAVGPGVDNEQPTVAMGHDVEGCVLVYDARDPA